MTEGRSADSAYNGPPHGWCSDQSHGEGTAIRAPEEFLQQLPPDATGTSSHPMLAIDSTSSLYANPENLSGPGWGAPHGAVAARTPRGAFRHRTRRLRRAAARPERGREMAAHRGIPRLHRRIQHDSSPRNRPTVDDQPHRHQRVDVGRGERRDQASTSTLMPWPSGHAGLGAGGRGRWRRVGATPARWPHCQFHILD